MIKSFHVPASDRQHKPTSPCGFRRTPNRSLVIPPLSKIVTGRPGDACPRRGVPWHATRQNGFLSTSTVQNCHDHHHFLHALFICILVVVQ